MGTFGGLQMDGCISVDESYRAHSMQSYGNGTSSSNHHGNQKVGAGEMSVLPKLGTSKISTSIMTEKR